MKKQVFMFLMCFLALGGRVMAQTSAHETAIASAEVAEISWEEDVHDFGTLSKDVPVSYAFTFTNTGDTPLIITGVKASCGCTATNYPKNPVNPGESASVTATYNAKVQGSFTKTITVYTNAKTSVKVLKIKGTVE